jgi:hypothetical protein
MIYACYNLRLMFKFLFMLLATVRVFFRTAARSGSPPPEQTKSLAVPAEYRFWLHQDQDLSPPGPDAA